MSLPIFSFVAHFASPLLIGLMITCPLYGIMLGQSVSYFRSRQVISNTTTILIAVTLLFEFLQTVGLAQGVASGYLNISVDLKIPKGILVDTYFGSFTMLLVQSALVYRVWLMTHKTRSVTYVLYAYAYCAISSPRRSRFNECIVASIGMIVTMTNALISQLIVYFVGIGALTSIFAILLLIWWIAMPHTLVFLIFQSILSKLYGNSLLVIFNSRSQKRDGDSRYTF
ncbi:hypothetical protein ONZ45_g13318 [Pleurotus djamor]|nr:hypothetical protein ONZ45_g13318 [Pleurotus djamor]